MAGAGGRSVAALHFWRLRLDPLGIALRAADFFE